MRRLRLMRRATTGLPALLLAAVLLMARLLVPAMAMPAGEGVPLPLAICHAGEPGEAPAPSDRSDRHDCLLCPACHLANHAALPAPTPSAVPRPALTLLGTVAPRPPATGPPHLVRTAAQPTGPPHLQA